MNLAAADQSVATSSKQWFESWFNSPHYHKLYAHRNETEAAAFVDSLVKQLRPRNAARALDLGCGNGRHSRQLALHGLRVTGLDLASSSILEAKKSENPKLRFVVHDMRKPFGSNKYDFVFNFFTSFGYFDHPTEHLKVVRSIANALTTGGQVVMDYLNVNYAEAHLTKSEIKMVDGILYRITRWADRCRVYKRIIIEESRTGFRASHLEKVAKFMEKDFRRMFEAHGLTINAVYGDYQLNPYDAWLSPRLILVASKEPGQTRFVGRVIA